jgi:hypothetical protein
MIDSKRIERNETVLHKPLMLRDTAPAACRNPPRDRVVGDHARAQAPPPWQSTGKAFFNSRATIKAGLHRLKGRGSGL